MKKICVGMNVCALAGLAAMFIVGSFTNDLEVQSKLTALDRAGAVNHDSFAKCYGGQFATVRDQSYARFLAAPWIHQWQLTAILGALLAASNIALALRKDKIEQEKK